MRHAVSTLALIVGLSACGSATAGLPSGPKDTTSAALALAAQLPDACSLLSADTITGVLDGPTDGGQGALERQGTLYANTCQWGIATGAKGAVGIQIGAADDTGHDMVRNRSRVLEPSLVSSAAPGAISSMNVAVMPVGGMKGSTVFFRFGELSVMVAVTGPNGNLGVSETLAAQVYAALAG